jgi:NADP-dependent 3-hydroxy acid dehydrogenase YdfG
VERWDPRLSALTILVEGAGLLGRVGALVRPAPVDQPPASELARLVEPGEFADMHGLVIGGSRGLGEATAKLLGVGGADVRLTYRTGEADAARVCQEIRAAGGRAEAAAFDVLEEGASFAALQDWSPSHLFYFPTSYISLNETTAFSARLFRAYGAYYVEGLVRCVEAALKLRPAQLTVFYPSTVALDEVLPKAIEYASAKAAGEAACAHLQRLHPQLRFRVSRLPRVLSDTTASILGAPALDAAEVMLGELRALRAGPPSRGKGAGPGR